MKICQRNVNAIIMFGEVKMFASFVFEAKDIQLFLPFRIYVMNVIYFYLLLISCIRFFLYIVFYKNMEITILQSSGMSLFQPCF